MCRVQDGRVSHIFESQCPHGHFCFFNTVDGFMALNLPKSQCPHGHFCFFNTSTVRQYIPKFGGSQCPHGHFCFFNGHATVESLVKNCLNALTGIFVFSIQLRFGDAFRGATSQCPHGHFCFFNPALKTEADRRDDVSMPSRAFLFFQ